MVGELDAQGHQPQLKRNDSTFAVKTPLNSWKNFNSDFCDGVKNPNGLLWGTILRPTIPREIFSLLFCLLSWKTCLRDQDTTSVPDIAGKILRSENFRVRLPSD
jgi:hypothetical protein